MDTIQAACAQLAGHQDRYVQELSDAIKQADRQRDDEFVKLKARLSTATAETKVLHAALKRKEAQLKNFQRERFGPSSEKSHLGGIRVGKNSLNTIQSAGSNVSEVNDIENVVGTTTEKVEAKPRGMLGKQHLKNPQHLRRETQIIEPDPDQFCSCGCGRVRMVPQVIEKLAHKPAEIYIKKEVYQKYTCRNCDRFVQARTKSRVFDYTRFDDSAVVGILVSKYADFLPLYRLEQIFGRSGARLSRATLSRLTLKAGALLKPIYEALLTDIKAESKLFADETRIPVLQPG